MIAYPKAVSLSRKALILGQQKAEQKDDMEIAVHIDASCTDDERLIKSLLKNADSFAQQGVIVPQPNRYRRLLRETMHNLQGQVPAEETRDILVDAILEDQEGPALSSAIPISSASRTVSLKVGSSMRSPRPKRRRYATCFRVIRCRSTLESVTPRHSCPRR